MRRPGIKSAFIAIFLVISLAFTVISCVTFRGTEVLNENTVDIALQRLPSIALAHQINAALLEERLSYDRHVFAVTKPLMADADEKIQAEIAKTDSIMAAYAPFATSGEDRQLFDAVKDGFSDYRKLGQNMEKLSLGNAKEFAKNYLEKDMNIVGQKIKGSVVKMIESNTAAASSAYNDSKKTYKIVFVIVVAVVAGASAIVIGSTAFAIVGIAIPIQIITRSMKRLSDGETGSKIPYEGRSDEIGDMAAAVEIFRRAGITNKQLAEEAEQARHGAEAGRARMMAEAEEAAQARLKHATKGLALGLRKLAGGDLSFQLKDAFAPDFEALRHDLNDAIEQLGATLKSVAGVTLSLDTGSDEISRSTNDLSRRTELQAASLEETAAALGRINSSTAEASKRADEACAVAAEATESARHCEKIVGDAVDAMGRIEQSSDEISSILVALDELTLQTNLLALNAGVEAARAGDAGRGFAVVAQEVRELARRSAESASQIKVQVRNSMKEVKSGVDQVRDTGKALKDIQDYIVKMNDHLIIIASSSREQVNNIKEISSSIDEMDKVMQQNAAMAEETNASTSSLVTDSNSMRELISKFLLPNHRSEKGSSSRGDQRATMTASSPRRAAA